MKKLSIAILLALFSVCSFAQNFEIPENYKLDKAEDYSIYEADVIKCINWLMETPENEQEKKRKDANAFLLIWLTGSPNVHIDINPSIVNFMKSSPGMLMTFFGGWTKYSLESKNFDDKVNGNLKGIEAVIKYYTKNIEFLNKDKKIEKFIKMKEKGKLEAFIKNNAK